MKPTHLEIVQGTPFRLLVRVKEKVEEDLVDLPITGGLVRLQARPSVESEDVLLDWSSEGTEITIEEEPGVFVIELSAEKTSAIDWVLPAANPRAVYQCEVTPLDGEPIRILQGTITLDREVVR